MLGFSPPIRFEVSGAAFSFYTPEEVRRLSVKKITEAASFDMLGAAVPGGVHDPSLGPTDKMAQCRTCGLIYKQCPGHFGHVDLAEPLYNPLLTRHLVALLRCGCWYCGALRLPRPLMECATATLGFVRDGDVIRAMAAHEAYQQLRAKGAADLDGSGGAESKRTMESIWAKLAPTLGRGSAAATSASPTHAAAAAMGALTREEQLVHLQNMRKELVRSLMKDMVSSTSRKCPTCGAAKVKTRRDDSKTKILLDGFIPGCCDSEQKKREKAELERVSANTTFVTPSRVREQLRTMWSRNSAQADFLTLIYNSRTVRGLPPSGPDMFFVEVLAVPPNRFRPVVELGSMKSENPQTALYKKIVALNGRLIQINTAPPPPSADAAAAAAATTETPAAKKKRAPRKSTASKAKGEDGMTRVETLVALQTVLNDLCAGGDPLKPPSIKDTLEKKEGLFRKHMMGKRVNFAARSVISPDPFIATNEIGLPLYFSMKLCFPEPVTAQNVDQLKQFVLNGPDVYPGANFVEDEFGNIVELRNKKIRASEASRLLTVSDTAPRRYKIVYRHVRDGDMALVNRQPTLHKPGIMAHAIRVLGKERTIRMHYVNCSTFNADFDGDEMNIHVPQGQLPRAEASVIAFTDEQYVVPKDGSPLRGLIQDSVITGVLLTKRDTFFTRSDFQQLVRLIVSLFFFCLSVHPITGNPFLTDVRVSFQHQHVPLDRDTIPGDSQARTSLDRETAGLYFLLLLLLPPSRFQTGESVWAPPQSFGSIRLLLRNQRRNITPLF